MDAKFFSYSKVELKYTMGQRKSMSFSSNHTFQSCETKFGYCGYTEAEINKPGFACFKAFPVSRKKDVMTYSFHFFHRSYKEKLCCGIRLFKFTFSFRKNNFSLVSSKE